MKFRPIYVDSNQRELTEHGTHEFPLSMDRQNATDKDCANIPHWHYEVQINLVVKGTVLFRTSEGEFSLNEGEGLFINSGVLHEIVSKTKKDDSAYICVNFNPSIIFGQSDSIIRRDYVEPIMLSEYLQSFPLKNGSWHKEICNLLQEMGQLNEKQEYGYELLMKVLLCKIWHLIVVNNREKAEKGASVSFTDRCRMKLLQTYISKNYMESITLKDIANAGHISRGECCRVFSRVKNMSPVTYLTKYRLSQSIKLLVCTDMSIADIAQQVGFSTSSYYAECFKRENNISPLQYRKMYVNGSPIANEETVISPRILSKY